MATRKQVQEALRTMQAQYREYNLISSYRENDPIRRKYEEIAWSDYQNAKADYEFLRDSMHNDFLNNLVEVR